jgi:hypothetical protein
MVPPPITGFFGLSGQSSNVTNNWAETALNYAKVMGGIPPLYNPYPMAADVTLVKPLTTPEVVGFVDKYTQLTYQETRLAQTLRYTLMEYLTHFVSSVDPVTRKNNLGQMQVLLHKKLQELAHFTATTAVTQTPYPLV